MPEPPILSITGHSDVSQFSQKTLGKAIDSGSKSALRHVVAALSAGNEIAVSYPGSLSEAASTHLITAVGLGGVHPSHSYPAIAVFESVHAGTLHVACVSPDRGESLRVGRELMSMLRSAQLDVSEMESYQARSGDDRLWWTQCTVNPR